MEELRSAVCPFPDFPKRGVCYWDTTPLLRSPALLGRAVEAFCAHLQSCGASCLAAIEAKGFPLGGALAYAAGLPLILVRKPGVTPGAVREVSFEKEYGRGAYQLKHGLLGGGERVYLLYDILAGPGATLAARKLLEAEGAELVGAAYVAELEYLSGREALAPLPVFSLVRIREEERDAAPAYKL